MLPDDIAQKIVDATMSIIENKNVNIMNNEGIIIASGEKHRINTYHKGAHDVITSSKTIEIYPEELDRFPGARQGINMPIKIGEKTAGVVGVFGHPNEVRIVANLVNETRGRFFRFVCICVVQVFWKKPSKHMFQRH